MLPTYPRLHLLVLQLPSVSLSEHLGPTPSDLDSHHSPLLTKPDPSTLGLSVRRT